MSNLTECFTESGLALLKQSFNKPYDVLSDFYDANMGRYYIPESIYLEVPRIRQGVHNFLKNAQTSDETEPVFWAMTIDEMYDYDGVTMIPAIIIYEVEDPFS